MTLHADPKRSRLEMAASLVVCAGFCATIAASPAQANEFATHGELNNAGISAA